MCCNHQHPGGTQRSSPGPTVTLYILMPCNVVPSPFRSWNTAAMLSLGGVLAKITSYTDASITSRLRSDHLHAPSIAFSADTHGPLRCRTWKHLMSATRLRQHDCHNECLCNAAPFHNFKAQETSCYDVSGDVCGTLPCQPTCADAQNKATQVCQCCWQDLRLSDLEILCGQPFLKHNVDDPVTSTS